MIINVENIEKEYNAATRNPVTGKLYMPSQKWGGWAFMPNGARCSFGNSFMTKEKAIEQAYSDIKNHKARIVIFRRSNPCKVVFADEWSETKQAVQSEKY